MPSVRRVARGALCFIAASVFASSSGEAAVERPFPVVTVTGEGTVAASPDTAATTASVSTEAKTTREAADANARTTQAMMAAIKQAGVADNDVQTARFSLAPVFLQRRDGAPPQIGGYRVVNTVTVRIRDVVRAGEIVDALIGAGATGVGALEFSIGEPSRLADEARQAAMADARRKAELYARAAGAQVGRPVSIAESEAEAPRPLALRSVDASQAASTPVTAGQQTIRVQVTVSFELNQ